LYYSVFVLDNRLNQRNRMIIPKPASMRCDVCESDRSSEWEEDEHECEPEQVCCCKNCYYHFFLHIELASTTNRRLWTWNWHCFIRNIKLQLHSH